MDESDVRDINSLTDDVDKLKRDSLSIRENMDDGTGCILCFGSALAMIISWGLNNSIGWAIWHGILGWLYVIYHWIIGVY